MAFSLTDLFISLPDGLPQHWRTWEKCLLCSSNSHINWTRAGFFRPTWTWSADRNEGAQWDPGLWGQVGEIPSDRPAFLMTSAPPPWFTITRLQRRWVERLNVASRRWNTWSYQPPVVFRGPTPQCHTPPPVSRSFLVSSKVQLLSRAGSQ